MLFKYKIYFLKNGIIIVKINAKSIINIFFKYQFKSGK